MDIQQIMQMLAQGQAGQGAPSPMAGVMGGGMPPPGMGPQGPGGPPPMGALQPGMPMQGGQPMPDFQAILAQQMLAEQQQAQQQMMMQAMQGQGAPGMPPPGPPPGMQAPAAFGAAPADQAMLPINQQRMAPPPPNGGPAY